MMQQAYTTVPNWPSISVSCVGLRVICFHVDKQPRNCWSPNGLFYLEIPSKIITAIANEVASKLAASLALCSKCPMTYVLDRRNILFQVVILMHCAFMLPEKWTHKSVARWKVYFAWPCLFVVVHWVLSQSNSAVSPHFIQVTVIKWKENRILIWTWCKSSSPYTNPIESNEYGDLY